MMAELSRTVKGRMIASVNDIAEMRQAFVGLTIERVDINYIVGGRRRSKAKVGELIIWNW
jgi:DNA adenine methylase